MSNTFLKTLKPFNNFLRIFGLSPCVLNSSKCTRSTLNFIWSGMILLTIQCYFAITIIYSPKRSDRFLVKIIQFLDVYSGVLIIWSGFVCQWLFSSDIILIMNGIHKFDQYARKTFKINVEQKYKNLKTCCILTIGGSLILITFSIWSTVLINIEIKSYAGYVTNISIPKIASNLILLPFLVLSLSLRQRLCWLNKTIVRERKILSKAINEKVSNSFHHNKILMFLEGVREKHINLSSMCRNLNKAYHAQFLSIMFKNVISITVGVFYGGFAILQNDTDFKYLFFPFIEAGVSAVQTLILTVVCSETTTQAQQTTQLIHRLSCINNVQGCQGFKKKINLEIMFFSLQTIHYKVEFTAFQMFVIKEKILVTVVATIITYVIIATQMAMLNSKTI